MHRTSSTTRVSDEFFNSSPSQSATTHTDQLPTYDPLSLAAKKEKIRIRSAENAIHAIPLVLLLCAIILWFFSNPVDIVNKEGASIVARPKDLATINGNVEGGLAQNRLLPDLEQDSDPTKEILHQKGAKSSENKS